MRLKNICINKILFDKFFNISYINLSSETEASSAGEQLARDSRMMVINNNHLVGRIFFPLYSSLFINIPCLNKRTLINLTEIPFHIEPIHYDKLAADYLKLIEQ